MHHVSKPRWKSENDVLVSASGGRGVKGIDPPLLVTAPHGERAAPWAHQ